MQKQRSIPTPLVPRAERPRVEIAALRPPSPLRIFQILGFAVATVLRWWATRIYPPLARGRYSPARNARRTRDFLERLGGLWIKAGQLIAMRRDMFSDAFCDELAELHDRATGFAPEIVRRILEEDLGAPISAVFSDFGEAPVAAASIGQTHEARLRVGGARVAVKIQRPDIARSFAREVRYLRLCVFLFRRLDFMRHVRWHHMLWQLEKTLSDELDYRLEASSIDRLRRSLRAHRVCVPETCARWCTRRVLVMEFIEGVFMSEYIRVATTEPARLAAWLAENDVDPEKVGQRLYLTHLRQIFEDNLYHCDLHPGNILLLRDSRVAFIDFGSVGSLDRSLLEKHHTLFRALTQSDYAKVADVFLVMSSPLPDTDMSEVKPEIIRMFRAWEARAAIKALPYHEKSLTHALGALARIFGDHGIPAIWELMLLNRAGLTLDASLMFLIPSVDYLALSRKYERKASLRALSAALGNRGRLRLAAQLCTSLGLPGELMENVKLDAEWFKRRGLEFERSITAGGYAGKVLATLAARGCVVAAAVAVVGLLRGAILGGSGPGWLRAVAAALPPYPLVAWGAVLVASLALRRMFARLAQHFRDGQPRRAWAEAGRPAPRAGALPFPHARPPPHEAAGREAAGCEAASTTRFAPGSTGAALLVLVLKALWVAFVIATPVLGAWVASSLAAYSSGPVAVAAATGLLLFPGFPLGWEAWSLYWRRRRGVTKPRILTFGDRLVLRTLAVNLVFLGVLLGTRPAAAFAALSTRGDWMLDGRQGPRLDEGAPLDPLPRGRPAVEWIYLAVHEDTFARKGDEPPPVPSATASATEAPPPLPSSTASTTKAPPPVPSSTASTTPVPPPVASATPRPGGATPTEPATARGRSRRPSIPPSSRCRPTPSAASSPWPGTSPTAIAPPPAGSRRRTTGSPTASPTTRRATPSTSTRRTTRPPCSRGARGCAPATPSCSRRSARRSAWRSSTWSATPAAPAPARRGRATPGTPPASTAATTSSTPPGTADRSTAPASRSTTAPTTT